MDQIPGFKTTRIFGSLPPMRTRSHGPRGKFRPLIVPTLLLAVLAAAVPRAARADLDTRLVGICTVNDAFLHQLMIAESGGRRFAKNPRSSALGPFQFLKSTFLDVTRRNFSGDIEEKSPTEVLALRTDTAFSRKVANAYSRENAAFLLRRGLKASAANLHLAFFAGPGGAARVLRADPETPAAQLLSSHAVSANPFLRRMTAAALIAKSRRHTGFVGLLSLHHAKAKRAKKGKGPRIKVRCNLGRPSCRKWLFLARKRLARKMAMAERRAKRTTAAGTAAPGTR